MAGEGKFRAYFNALDAAHGVASGPRERVRLDKTYCILITPRSGSTWLARRIAGVDVLSCPGEHFNAELFGATLKHNAGRDIYEVFDAIAAKNRTRQGLFGFEISYFDLEELEFEARLLDLMVGEKFFFYLSRRNFVAQAISLHTAVESKIFHSFQPEDEPRKRSDVPYDDDKIMFWVSHILQQEFGIHQWMTANNLEPMRLHYEELCADIDAVIRKMAAHLGVDLQGIPARPTAQTQRITADSAPDYERRFRSSHEEFCRKWQAARGTEPCPFTGVAPTL
ncbi:MAG TPA: Stf0 family sulfotransferase [Stellaceae bacterium]|nr:Stf0 family sulfotransferase [Stellaceae bacterium]